MDYYRHLQLIDEINLHSKQKKFSITKTEIETHYLADGGSGGGGDGVGDVVPALDGADAEDWIDGVERGGEIGGGDILEKTAVDKSEDHD